MTLEHHFVVSVKEGVVGIDYDSTDVKFDDMRIFNHKDNGWESYHDHERSYQIAHDLLEKIIEASWKTTLPCDKCQTPIDKDIYAEELGMCVDCSNDYFDHKES